MKNRYLLISLIIIFFASCKNMDKGNEIINDDSLIFTYHRWGGWTALDEKLIINPGATHYSISYHDLKTHEIKSFQTTVETSNKQWKSLIKTFDLEIFMKIQNGLCRSCVDGTDEIFSVTVDDETYTFSNGDSDEYYMQMQEFFDAIKVQMDDFESSAKY